MVDFFDIQSFHVTKIQYVLFIEDFVINSDLFQLVSRFDEVHFVIVKVE